MWMEPRRRAGRRLTALGVALAIAVPIMVPGTARAATDEPAEGASASYRMTDLGTGYDYDSRPIGFGPGGLIAGWVTVGFENRTAIWRRGHRRAEVIGPATSSPLVVSSRGEVFSQVIPSDPAVAAHVVRWQRGVETLVADGYASTAIADGRGRVLLRFIRPDGTEMRLVDGPRSRALTGLPEALPPIPPSPYPREPYFADMNDRGEIVGAIDRDDTVDDAFVWRDGTTTYLPALPDAGPPEYAGAIALGIDDHGVIVGSSSTRTGAHPVLWHRGRVVDLGVPPGFTSCNVNDWSGPLTTGWIVGSCTRGGDDLDAEPFVWHRGTYTILPTLGGASATATAVNSRGVVAGTSDRLPEGRHAVAWHDDTAIDLGTLGGLNSSPVDIDEQGRIVGIAELPDGRTHAVLWTPRHSRT